MNAFTRLTVVAAAAQVLLFAAHAAAASGDKPTGEQAKAPGTPEGIEVYVSDIHDVADGRMGTGSAAIALVGARNGSFSGKVVVRSGRSIHGLKAVVGDLKQSAAVIPAANVLVRYGVPWEESVRNHPKGTDLLLDAPPTEVPVTQGAAVVAVWVTVQVPKDAPPGLFAGRVAIEVKDQPPTAVPVTIDVREWTVPDTQDWRTWIELIQSPETLAVAYDVPLWSEKHWELIAESFRLIGQTGSRVVYVPLVCHTNQGNEQTMVRWVRKGDSYQPDYTIAERYLDVALKHLGRPKLVIFYAWDVFLNPPSLESLAIKDSDTPYLKEEKGRLAVRARLKGKGPSVTVLDPQSGKTEMVNFPPYADPVSRALWQPVWSELRKRMRERGLEQNMRLGVVSDTWPTKEDTVFFDEVTGGLAWTSCSHHAHWVIGRAPTTKQLYRLATVDYSAVALDYQFCINPAKNRSYGWQKPFLHSIYWRFTHFNIITLSNVRTEPEANITGNQRGVGRLGAEFWPVFKNRRGSKIGSVVDRAPESYWHSLNIMAWMLGQGPAGPVATARLEVLREGVQECEARIAIESALTDEAAKARLGNDLAGRAQEILDQRQRCLWKSRGADESDFQTGLIIRYREFYGEYNKKWDKQAGNAWFVTSGWPQRAGELFAAAGEVAKKLQK